MKKRSLKLFFGILLAVHGYSQKAEEALTGDLLFRNPACLSVYLLRFLQ
jgi:hypothetical protein